MKNPDNKFKCLQCDHNFNGYVQPVPLNTPKPHPNRTAGPHITCPLCNNLYVEWLNYSQDFEK